MIDGTLSGDDYDRKQREFTEGYDGLTLATNSKADIPYSVGLAQARRPGEPVVKYEVKTPTYFARVSVQPALRTATILNSAYPAQIVTVGEVAAGKTVMLRRGARLAPSPQEPTWSR